MIFVDTLRHASQLVASFFFSLPMSKKQIIQDPDFGMIVVTTRKLVRNITMRVKENGLYVTVPPYSSLASVLRAIDPYRERLLATREKVQPKPFDWNFKIESECFRLRLVPSRLKNFTVRIVDDEVEIYCPEDSDFETQRVQTLIRNAIMRALRKKAEEFLPPLVALWASRFELDFRQVKISKARTRWGSCSSEKNISLSFYLMLVPAHLMDYVILHELAHTREMNHGPRFWELLDNMTDGKALALRKEMRAYHPVF